MEIEELRSFREEIGVLPLLKPSVKSNSIKTEEMSNNGQLENNENGNSNIEKSKKKLSDFQRKCMELGLEQNDSSSGTLSSKSEKSSSADSSEEESSSEKSKSNSGSSSALSSTTSSSSSSSAEDNSDEESASENEYKETRSPSNISPQDIICSSEKSFNEISPVNGRGLENFQFKKENLNNQDDNQNNRNALEIASEYYCENNNSSIQNPSLTISLNKSIKRKIDNIDEHIRYGENSSAESYSESMSPSKHANAKTLKLNNEQKIFKNHSDSKPDIMELNPKTGSINLTSSDINKPNDSTKTFSLSSQISSDLIDRNKVLPKSVPNQRKSVHTPKNKTKGKLNNQPKNLLEQVAAAFAEQLSGLNLGQLTQHQLNQLNLVLAKQNSSSGVIEPLTNSGVQSNSIQKEVTPNTSPTCGTPNRHSLDTDDMPPIQAEVVMTDGSENEGLDPMDGKNFTFSEHLHYGEMKVTNEESLKVNEEIDNYLDSFIQCSTKGTLVEYPPINNEVPKDGSDLTQWQLEKVALPPFTPFVPPPSWLRFTIPPEGYKCHSCGDTFFIESSLVQHRERRSVWISIECGPCDAKLTFYNKCSYKDHIDQHIAKGERVDEDTVLVRSLPLQLAKLLQPIIVPVPQSLRPMKILNKDSAMKPKRGVGAPGEHTGKENQPKGESYDSNAIAATESIGSPSKRAVKCYLCERVFFSVRELMSHMRTNQSSSDQRVECRKCLLVLPSVCAAKAHILTHPPANSSNISVCPECGSRCDGPRDFVHHLNTCGHQYRRSGVLCGQCQVCFFKFADDFVNHWIKEHCSKSYECVVCCNTFESLIFHKCSSPGEQVLATFKCLVMCPLCPFAVQLQNQEERDTHDKIRGHLSEMHPSVLNRVHYVYKSKFCTNAFRSKDELRAHHDREHRRDNHYRTKTCTLHHEVLGYQHQFFNGQEPRNAFITMPVTLSPEEIQEAQTRDVPTVSSVIDKTLFPDGPVTLENVRGLNSERGSGAPSVRHSFESKDSPVKLPPVEISSKKRNDSGPDALESLRPCVCYKCGYTYTGSKDFRRHKRSCEGERAVRLCQVCGVSAIGKEFAKHCLTHVKEGLIICMYCNGAPFPTQAMLQQHFELHVHEQFAYPALCAFCSFPMPDVGMALAHLYEEHDPSSSPTPSESLDLACERCGRKFHGERGLNVHLTRCGVGSVPVVIPMPTVATGRQCQVCKKALTSEMFGKHIISHLEEGLLVCSLCDGLTLPSSMALLHHLEEHASTLQYPSVCPMCSFEMCDASDALTHLKEDHGFGNLKCSSCEMHYTFTYQLQRHIDIVHKVCLYAKRRYICWICRAYDHVKKETLMNHFRTVHGLSMEEVDEKVMIRTRGQGTMPTSQFIPTKPLGSKELGSSSKGEAKADVETITKAKGTKSTNATPASTSSHRSRVKSQEEETSLPDTKTPSKDDDKMEINLENIVIKKELLDVIGKISESESSIQTPSATPAITPPKNYKTSSSAPPEAESKMNLSSNASPMKASPKLTVKNKSRNTPMKPIRKAPAKNRDQKLKEKTKVLIRRLPESVFRRRSRLKKGRAETLKVGEKAFKCTLCSYATNSRSKFDHHCTKHEAKGKNDGFVCSECGQSFVVEPSLKRHLFFAHKIKHKPSVPPKTTNTTATSITTQVSSERRKKIIPKKNTRNKFRTQKPSSSTAVGAQDRKITLKIKNSAKVTCKDGKKGTGGKESELQCCVCKEQFESSIKMYSHLRTHGMAFLKIGRKKRSMIQEKN